jgi:hypothetical protein
MTLKTKPWGTRSADDPWRMTSFAEHHGLRILYTVFSHGCVRLDLRFDKLAKRVKGRVIFFICKLPPEDM